MSDLPPRTADAAKKIVDDGWDYDEGVRAGKYRIMVSAEFAAQLEKELAEATKFLSASESLIEHHGARALGEPPENPLAAGK